jgi:hypothetical protein
MLQLSQLADVLGPGLAKLPPELRSSSIAWKIRPQSTGDSCIADLDSVFDVFAAVAQHI